MIKISEYNDTYAIVKADYMRVVQQFLTEVPRFSRVNNTSAEFCFEIRGEYGWETLVIRVNKI